MTLPLRIYQFAFGCRHTQLSGVFTINRRTYQVCFDCGQEQEYSWARMQAQSGTIQPVVSQVAQTPNFTPAII
jgi:hypothetical protein